MDRRDVDFADFDQLRADVDRLHQGGYTKAGGWDLSQVLQHVTKSLNESVDGGDFALPWLVRVTMGPLIKRKMFRERRIKPGFKAPTQFIFEQMDESAAVDAFREALGRVERADAFKMHPIFGHISGDEWRTFHLIHIGHHLSFLLPTEASDAEAA